MIKKFLLSKPATKLLILSLFLLVISCNRNPFKIDTSSIQLENEIKRFDQDLFLKNEIDQAYFNELQKKYTSFFDLYTQRLNPIPANGDSVGLKRLNAFIKDSDAKFLKTVTDSVFPTFSEYESQLYSFWKHYAYYFPDKIVPDVVTYISDFRYNIIALDSTVGVALNMYYGNDWEPYKSLFLEQYRVNKMNPDRMVIDVAKGWYASEYVEDTIKTEFITFMIYQGKLLYYLDAMFPDLPDHKKIGYSDAQYNWMNDNEGAVWAFFIENELIYNKQLTDFMKFIHDGNTTSGFPPEAPAQMGSYIGWQIIKSYMNNNSDIGFKQLIEEPDVYKILRESNYKPKK